MKIIHGPFAVDPNVSNPSLHFDGTFWCVVRRSLNEVGGKEFGIIKFRDVRTYRSRPRVSGVSPDLGAVELPPSCWFIEEEDSPFLEASRATDSQRTPAMLSSHRHFIVTDGNNVAIDVFARDFTLLQRDQVKIDIRELIDNDEHEL